MKKNQKVNKNKNKELTYGLHDGKLLHISKVENGLECNCICANCATPLIAKNNRHNIKIPHFAHFTEKPCTGYYETTLHLLAKQILMETKEIRFPYLYKYYEHGFNENKLKYQKGKFDIFKIDKVSSEIKISGHTNFIIADLVGEINNKDFIIEIACTHFVDIEKKRKIIELNIPCIEINLSGISLDESEIIKIYLSETPLKYWIFNPEYESLFRRELDEEIQEKEKANLEREKREREFNEAKLKEIQDYETKKNKKIYKSKTNEVINCPENILDVNKFKGEKFYKHKILKQIIDDNNWNFKIFKDYTSGTHIYLNNQKIEVYPKKLRELSPSEIDNSNLFYTGLKKLENYRKLKPIIKCSFCNYCERTIIINDTFYSVCKHPKAIHNSGK
ncbi:MAG TPA: hypothetical protein VJA82_10645 [Sediminibacterium sp.]|nr:hypothetical protein [Sediminibacterium sp.]